MSGRNENPNYGEFRCENCGCTQFKYIHYGYKVCTADVMNQQYNDGSWEADDGEGWNCVRCGHRVPEEFEQAIFYFIIRKAAED